MNNQKTDDGRILILDVKINDVNLVLINLYTANTETEQVSVLNNLSSLLQKFDVNLEKTLILARVFKLKIRRERGKTCYQKNILS